MKDSVMSNKESGGRVVLISEFCRQYGVKQQIQERYGLLNDGVERLSREEFEAARRCLRKRKGEDALVAKRQRISGGGDGDGGNAETNVSNAFDGQYNGPCTADSTEFSLLYSDSFTYGQETVVSHDALSLDGLKGITLISSSSGKNSEPENNQFYILQSDQPYNGEIFSSKDSSPPVDFSPCMD